MKKISSYILLIIAISTVNTQDCGYNFLKAQYQGSCIGNCQTYSNFEDAQNNCNKLDACVGISFAKETVEDGLYKYPCYYLTGKGNYKFSVGQTLVKNCNDFRELSFNHYIEHVGKEIPGISINKSYKTLEEAQDACFDNYQCNGVTYSGVVEFAGYIVDGEFGFQLRTGNSLNPSQKGESSWQKIKLEY